jgi:hypothetical protein
VSRWAVRLPPVRPRYGALRGPRSWTCRSSADRCPSVWLPLLFSSLRST